MMITIGNFITIFMNGVHNCGRGCISERKQVGDIILVGINQVFACLTSFPASWN
jgi:hypothetical protein